MRKWELFLNCLNFSGRFSSDLKVISDLSHFRPWMAYLFLLMLVFSSGPNLSGTPHRGRLIALATEHTTRLGFFMQMLSFV